MLTELQKDVLDKIFSIDLIRQHFYLTGGTALAAYYYNHRISDDLDLFTHDIEIDSIEHLITDSLKGFEFEKSRSSPTFRRFIIKGELQLDFVKDVDFRVGAPQLFENIMVDTVKNIAVNKLLAIYGRLDPKDYVDFYYILKSEKYKIMELIKLGHNKDAGLEPFQWARVIADVDSFSILPRMTEDFDLNKLKSFFHKLRDEILDKLKPKTK